MKKIPSLPCLAALFLAADAFAAPPPETAPTNSIHSMLLDADIIDHHLMIEHAQTPQGFWKRMDSEFLSQAGQDSINRFDLPAARLRWQSEFFDGYRANAAWARSGRDLGIESLRRAARETIGSSLPIDEWEDSAFGFARRHLLRIDDTDQAQIRYADANPTVGEIAWIEGRERHYDYGLDPLDGQIFGKVFVGHAGKDSLGGNGPIAILMGRYVIDSTSPGRLQAGITFPLPYSWRITATGTADPSRLDSIGNHAGASWAVRLERISVYEDGLKLLYFGFQSNDNLVRDGQRSNAPMFAAGLTMPLPGRFWKKW